LLFTRKNTICYLFILLAAFVFTNCKTKNKNNEPFAYQLPANTNIDKSFSDTLNIITHSWYDNFLKRSGFNGGIIIAKGGNIIFENYNGIAHLNRNDTVNAYTSLHIASVSKTFTAMTVLKLWQDHKLNLDDEYVKYFPGFDYPGVTIRTLLNHRSGLPNYTYFIDELKFDRKTPVTNQDILNCLVNRKSELKNINPANRHFSYCNTNYALLALLIEKVTQTSYPVYLKKIIFDPLRMKNTFVYTKELERKVNPSYDWKGMEIGQSNLDLIYGDKNIYSTPEDLLQWDRLLTSDLFLSKETKEEAYKPYSNEKSGTKNYGLGWRMYNFPNDYKIIYHNGWWHGSNAVFIRLIKEDATIIAIGNKFNKNIYKAKELIGLFSNLNSIQNEEE
jgi:CubicO group peptidase (beta-lactamase class C family)